MKWAHLARAKGQDLVEYALILPIMLMIIAVIFDLGRVTFIYSTLSNLTREAARYGVIDPCDTSGNSTNVENVGKARAIGIDPNALTFLITQPSYDCALQKPTSAGDATIVVNVSYVFTPMTPFVAQVLNGGNSLTLNSTATMYIEY